MEQHLVQNASQHVAVAGVFRRRLHRLGNGAAQGAGGAGVLLENLPADFRLHGGRRGDGGAVGPHDLPAEGLLLVADLHHIDLAVQAQIGAGHGEGGAPLARSGLGGDAGEPLPLGVVRLGDGGIQLVGAGGVVSLKLVVDVRRGLELFLQAVGPDQGRGAVHLVKVPNLLWNGNFRRFVVQLLADQLVAEDGPQILEAHGSPGAGVPEGGGLGLHVGPDIVPGVRHLRLGEIDFVGDVLEGHDACSFLLNGLSRRRSVKKRPPSTKGPITGTFGTKVLKLLRCHPNWRSKNRPLGGAPTRAFPW